MKNLWEEFKIANRNQDDINKDYGRISGYIRKYLSREEIENCLFYVWFVVFNKFWIFVYELFEVHPNYAIE